MYRPFPSLAIGLCLAAVGCAKEEPWALTEAGASSAFTDDVYPVLLRDCAFPACHGAPERLFKVWGPRRTRLGSTEVGTDAEERERVGMEMQRTYQSAISFVDVKDPTRSLLLRKGLDSQAGGTGHLGLDKYGRNVYRSADSQGYVELSTWVFSLSAQQQTTP